MIQVLVLLAVFWPFTTSGTTSGLDVPAIGPNNGQLAVVPDKYRATGKYFVNVANRAQLMAALSSLSGPTVISLSSGVYNNVVIKGRHHPLRIQSASPDEPAKISGLKLQDVIDVTLLNIDLIHPNNTTNAALHARPNTVSNSRNVTFQNSRFIGTIATQGRPHDIGYPSGHGLFVSGAIGVKVIGCEFKNWHRGAIFTKSRDIEIDGNNIHSLRSDGLNFSAVQGVLIKANRIHDFTRSLASKDHSDMIQFWTRGTKTPSKDIVIKDNILDMGQGSFTQSIFMRNEVMDQAPHRSDFFYQNVRIFGNAIHNTHTHGITVGQSRDLVVAENTLTFPSPGDSLTTPIIRVHPTSVNVDIRGNRATKIKGHSQQESWHVAGNAPP